MFPNMFVTCSLKELKFWNACTQKNEISISEAHENWIFEIIILPNNQIATSGSDQKIKIWSLKRGPNNVIKPSLQTTLEGHISAVTNLALLNKQEIVSGDSKGYLRVWEIQSGKLVNRMKISSLGVNCILAITHHQIATCTRDENSIDIYNVHTSSKSFKLEGHRGLVWKLVKVSDERIASCSNDKSIILWNWRTGKILERMEGHESPVKVLECVGNGQYIVSVDVLCTMKVWSLETIKCVASLEKCHDSFVNCVRAISIDAPIGSQVCCSNTRAIKLLTCSDDRYVKEWDFSEILENKKAKGYLYERSENDIMRCVPLNSGGEKKVNKEQILLMLKKIRKNDEYIPKYLRSVVCKEIDETSMDNLPLENSIGIIDFQKLLFGIEVENTDIFEEQYFDLFCLFKRFGVKECYFKYLYRKIGEISDIDILGFLLTKSLRHLEQYSCPAIDNGKTLYVVEPVKTGSRNVNESVDGEQTGFPGKSCRIDEIEGKYRFVYTFLEKNLHAFIRRVEISKSSSNLICFQKKIEEEKKKNKEKVEKEEKIKKEENKEKEENEIKIKKKRKRRRRIIKPVVFHHNFTYVTWERVRDFFQRVCKDHGYTDFIGQFEYLSKLNIFCGDFSTKSYNNKEEGKTMKTMKDIYKENVEILWTKRNEKCQMDGLVKLKCVDNSGEFYAHLDVLVWNSVFFWKLLNFNGKEKKILFRIGQKNERACIGIHFLDKNSLGLFLEYLYKKKVEHNYGVHVYLKLLEFSEMHFERNLQKFLFKKIYTLFRNFHQKKTFWVEIAKYGAMIKSLPEILEEKLVSFFVESLGVNIDEVNNLMIHSLKNQKLIQKLIE